ncbi:MAG TPA: cyclic nucleotide-binding domain-containing protein [Anaerolineales bacterium]|nr:cyclic nucleotide-binding domain-containing protein [Anaerolineales bacterium]
MADQIRESLKDILLFHGLPDPELDTLGQKALDRSYATGEALMRQGESGDSLFLIVNGKVKIVSENAQGGELILNQCGPGETIGEMALFDQGKRSATVVAVQPTQALELKRQDFLDLINQRPELSLSLIRSNTARLRFATTYIEKAIELSKHITDGDYSTVMSETREAQPAADSAEPNAAKAERLLSAFFRMAQEVKAREDQLKQEVRKLMLEIDETRRRQQVEEVTGTDFYAHLKSEAARLRRERQDGES